MVIQISNKTTSSSTCVLVRIVMEGEISFSQAARIGVQSRALLHLLFPVIQVLLFSFCLLLVPALYSSDIRGSLPTEHGGEKLDILLGKGQGRPGLPLKTLCLLSVVPPASCPSR